MVSTSKLLTLIEVVSGVEHPRFAKGVDRGLCRAEDDRNRVVDVLGILGRERSGVHLDATNEFLDRSRAVAVSVVDFVVVIRIALAEANL